MLTVTVDKDTLRHTLIANKEAHASLFQTAIDKYHARLLAELQTRIDLLKAGKEIDLYFRLPIPEEHTDDYERAIQMLEWHEGKDITLNENEFSQYVQDNWGWAKAFAQNTASYTK